MKKIFLTLFAMAAMTVQAQTVVSTTTDWNFNDQAIDTKVEGPMKDFNGLVVRAQPNHESDFKSSRLKGVFGDGAKWVSKVGLNLKSNKGITIPADMKADSKVTGRTDRCFAITTDKPGTLYVAYRSRANDAARTVQLWFGGKVVVEQNSAEVNAQSGHLGTMEYKTNEGGTFVFGGSGQTTVLYVRFAAAE